MPTLGADDFTVWLTYVLTLGYATGESDGPYLLDPAGYYASGLSATHIQALESGFYRLKEVGKRLCADTRACAFKPSWYYDPLNASKSMSTMTTGTYI